MIVRELKTIFFHVGKCAGSSIESALKPNSHPIIEFNEELMVGLMKDEGYAQHFTIEQMLKYCPSEMEKYFKFTFVRNPYSRIASAFCYNRKSFNNDVDYFFHVLPHKSKIVGSHFYPQHYYTHNNGIRYVDFIGKFENLEDDFQIVCNRLHINNKLPHLTKRTSTIDFDDNQKRVINKIYEDDFKLLNYEMEDL